jgi:hypothetical protein
MWRGYHFLNLHPIHPASKLFSIDRISIPEEIERRGIIRKGFDDGLFTMDRRSTRYSRRVPEKCRRGK